MANFKTFVFCFLVYFVVAGAEHCTPGIVPNVSIASDKILHWSAAVNPSNCSISGYIVNILDPEDGTLLQFDTVSIFYNLSFLDLCRPYLVEVHAITDENVLGPADSVNATIPPTAHINLALHVNSTTILNKDQIHLSWNPVSTDVTRCISYYRVVYWDENNNPTDVYVPTNSFILKEVVPCMTYTFQVSAVITNPDTEGPFTESSSSGYTAVTTPPKLIDIKSGKTTVNMTWQVPAYSENRCQLISLVIDALGLPSTCVTTISIEDSPLRPNVNVYLKDLTPDTAYIGHVALQNIAGYSKNVTVLFQTSDSFVFSNEKDLIY